jgi:SAM-dependent methyltransferase
MGFGFRQHLRQWWASSQDPLAGLDPQGAEGVALRGHRGYVGGLWEEMGELQFQFLLSRGLQPEHYLLDIACGSLRLGVKAIPYLQVGHYLGVEKESTLIEAGLQQELSAELVRTKCPQIVQSDSFAFDQLGQQVDMALAQSLFTHLPPVWIEQCLRNLRPWLQADGTFYATFFEVEQPRRNPDVPHDHGYFAYTKAEMASFGSAHGYSSHYIGDWSHPRGQVMMAYRPL